MKKIMLFLLIVPLFLPTRNAAAQCTEPRFATDEDTIVDPLSRIDPRAFIAKDRNSEIEEYTDSTFNNYPYAYVVNGVFTRSLIGIDQYKKKNFFDFTYPVVVRHIGKGNDSMVIKSNPLRDPDYLSGTIKLRDMRLRDVLFLTYSGNSHFVTPDDVRQKYCPHAKGPYLYMINKFFIMHDEDLYKIDPDFIQSVESFPSKDISLLKEGYKKFTVIRIFTKTLHNIYVQPIN